jgi:hypothetical protein
MGASLLSTMSNTEFWNGIGGIFEVGVRTTMTGWPQQFFAASRHIGKDTSVAMMVTSGWDFEMILAR